MKPGSASKQSNAWQDGTGELAKIAVNQIRPNPENPRLTFRQGELDELQESIRRYGVKVPIAVFKSGTAYVLIDGERRWRCASKLNLKTIPALIQPEPDPLQNLLLMFNIHALREQWDLLTVALKLPKVISLLENELERVPTEIDLSEYTGLSRGWIRRCRLLTQLPKKYLDLLLEELKKPQSKRAVGEDFFIEMEKALKSVMRAMPDAIDNIDSARDVLLAKYRAKLIQSNIEFRKLAKIARASKVGADLAAAKKAIKRLVSDPRYSITEAWTATVSEAYIERDILTRIELLLAKLSEVTATEMDLDVREKLEELVERAQKILEDDE
jgi:ParB/RepB/Spo0J family partition protein